MKTTGQMTIAALTVSAALLLTAILLIGGSNTAQAGQSESVGRGYTMIPAQVTSSRDLIYVVDHNSEQIIAYIPERDIRSRQITLVAGPTDLRRIVTDAAAARNPAAR